MCIFISEGGSFALELTNYSFTDGYMKEYVIKYCCWIIPLLETSKMFDDAKGIFILLAI